MFRLIRVILVSLAFQLPIGKTKVFQSQGVSTERQFKRLKKQEKLRPIKKKKNLPPRPKKINAKGGYGGSKSMYKRYSGHQTLRRMYRSST